MVGLTSPPQLHLVPSITHYSEQSCCRWPGAYSKKCTHTEPSNDYSSNFIAKSHPSIPIHPRGLQVTTSWKNKKWIKKPRPVSEGPPPPPSTHQSSPVAQTLGQKHAPDLHIGEPSPFLCKEMACGPSIEPSGKSHGCGGWRGGSRWGYHTVWKSRVQYKYKQIAWNEPFVALFAIIYQLQNAPLQN